jgi:hypothetical protein
MSIVVSGIFAILKFGGIIHGFSQRRVSGYDLENISQRPSLNG